MMLAFDVQPPRESIREGLKQLSIRSTHNNRQRCELSKCPLAYIARRTVALQRHVCFGSKADMCSATRHVRFGPNSGHLQRTS